MVASVGCSLFWDVMSKNGISASFGASDDVPRVFLLKPMTARFSVLKNVLSGRFNARDDSGSSKWQKSRHSSYLYPLWRFLRKIGWVFSSSIACPMYPTSVALV